MFPIVVPDDELDALEDPEDSEDEEQLDIEDHLTLPHPALLHRAVS